MTTAAAAPSNNEYRWVSKPQDVQAIRWTGDKRDLGEIERFGADVRLAYPVSDVAASAFGPNEQMLFLLAGKDGAQGYVPVPAGHWIVRAVGDLSHHWPVEHEYFVNKYVPAGSNHHPLCRRQHDPETGPDWCDPCSAMAEQWIAWDGHTRREAHLIRSLSSIIEYHRERNERHGDHA